jgi:hypothetical protein
MNIAARTELGYRGHSPRDFRPLKLLSGNLLFKTSAEGGLMSDCDVLVGLANADRYPLPARFQQDYDRQFEANRRLIYQVPLQSDDFRINGCKVEEANFIGFSRSAANEPIDENRELVRLAKSEMGIDIGNAEKARDINALLPPLIDTLGELGLDSDPSWGKLIPHHYASYYSFPPTKQPTVNLFRMALNFFRMRQLTDLMIFAYRGNTGESHRRLDGLIAGNMKERLSHCIWESGPDGGNIERLDLQLRLDLIKEICRKKLGAENYAPNGGFESLALFTWGDAYRETEKFFLEAGARFRDKGAENIFRTIVTRNAYMMEMSMMEAAAEEMGIWKIGPLAKMMTGEIWLLPYQGARVIDAYERAFNVEIEPGWMMSEPLVPFDLGSMIEMRYAFSQA